MSANKNKSFYPRDILGVIKQIAIAVVLIVAIFGIAANFMTTPVNVEKPTKEVWLGTPTIKVLYPRSTYPDIKDVSANPALAGIEVMMGTNIRTREKEMVIKNLNKDFIAINGGTAIMEIVATGEAISMPLSKEVFIAFPDSRGIKTIYYFDLGHY